MPQVIVDLLRSKRFVVVIAGTVAALAAKAGLDLNTEALAVILAPVVAYILGQSHVDAKNPPAPPAE
jgi:hypothetical protein